MRAIRVLYELHPVSVGGTERFLARFFERLDRRRYEPVVVSARAAAPLRMMKAIGVQSMVVDYFTKRGPRRLARVIEEERIDLIQSNYYSSQVAMAANLAEVPHIWRLGGHVEVGSNARTAADERLTLQMILMLSRGIVCNSRFVRRQFGRGAPVVVIPNGITIPPAARREHEGFRVAMIAHFTPQKRHADFIRAAEIVSAARDDVTFIVAGREHSYALSRRYAMKVAGWARGLQERGKLGFSQFVSGDGSALGDFDLVVLPSVGESLSNAILEAMAAGVPVVAARSGGNPELVEHGKTGLLVPPMRPQSLARAILSLLADPARLALMGRAARHRAETRFSMDECVKRYEAEYARVLSG